MPFSGDVISVQAPITFISYVLILSFLVQRWDV
uniref:Uncharacterized protein n=1 Tax=Arundo donax TaxID=35708 RepID=A0A0A9AWG5_ARUDO